MELDLAVQSTAPVEGEPDLLASNRARRPPRRGSPVDAQLPAADLTGWEVSGEATGSPATGVDRLMTVDPLIPDVPGQ